MFDWFRRVNGQAAADLGYVNPGTDYRIGGELGRKLGAFQSALSFKSATPPVRQVHDLPGGTIFEVATAPNGREHYALAVPRGEGEWFTLRVGFRYDGNWGDENSIGHNPQPEIKGGYFPDWVLKARARQTFIAGREQG